ncbi:MAG: hypothetical protein VKS61_00025 [Candidatus Sericytochromatia bacterium]|nr:hypothetical protein [Candidatus Sericytochromatia bacterium]
MSAVQGLVQRAGQGFQALGRELGQGVPARATRGAAPDLLRLSPAARAALPLPAAPAQVPHVLEDLVAIAAARTDRPAGQREVTAGFQRFAATTWALPEAAGLTEAQRQVAGRFTVDGVPGIVNAVLRGDMATAQADGFSWSLLGPDRGAWVQAFKDLFDFSTAIPVERPKLLFHATGRKFHVGQELGAFLSMTEVPGFAAKYVPHATQSRRVVSFLIEGAKDAPGHVGLIKNSGWNEVIVPPGRFRVASVEQTAFGEVVTLRPKEAPLAATRQAFQAQVEGSVPATVSEL